MLKYVSKIAMDILPSVVATIIGAYIVNHYINKPAAEAPVAAAVSSVDPNKADVRNGTKPSRATAEFGNIPTPGVTAKGVSERGMIEKTLAEKPTNVEQSSEKPAETASVPADTKRHPSAPKIAARTVQVPAPVVQPAPAVAAPVTAPPVEAAVVAPEEHRDVNDLARAAIERLRGIGDSPPRAQETARVPDAARSPDAPRIASAPSVTSPVPSVRPLPPPIMVSTPPAGNFDQTTGSLPANSSYPAAGNYDPDRPTPPADIPVPMASPPLDLRAEAEVPQRREHTTVAEDMMLAAKSVFHAVLPK